MQSSLTDAFVGSLHISERGPVERSRSRHTLYGATVSFQQCYLAVLSNGCRVPTSFLTFTATLLSSSLRRQRRLINEVGYPTIFSASETTLLQFEGPELENKLSALCPRLYKALQQSRQHVVGSIFRVIGIVCHTVTQSLFHPLAIIGNSHRALLLTICHKCEVLPVFSLKKKHVQYSLLRQT